MVTRSAMCSSKTILPLIAAEDNLPTEGMWARIADLYRSLYWDLASIWLYSLRLGLLPVNSPKRRLRRTPAGQRPTVWSVALEAELPGSFARPLNRSCGCQSPDRRAGCSRSTSDTVRKVRWSVMRRRFPLLSGPIFGTMRIRHVKRQEDPRKHAKERQELAH